MTDTLTAPLPRPTSTNNPLDVGRLAELLRDHVTDESSSPRFTTRLAKFVEAWYVDIPIVAKARRRADETLEAAYPDKPPAHSCTYRYIITLPTKEYNGWDRERCQRLCAAVFAAYRLRYPSENT